MVKTSKHQVGTRSPPPPRKVAALYVDGKGVYSGRRNVDLWPAERDARLYCGPHRVVAHPPCERWGRYWHGGTSNPHQFKRGSDGGCFAAALYAVRTFGGVLEHPADSSAWDWFGLTKPKRGGGWVRADNWGGWTCYVEQGHYGHMARKGTWLYAVNTRRFELKWGPSEQKIHPVSLKRYGYERARHIGMMAMVGGNRHDMQRKRNATPKKFCELLLTMVRSRP